jgi:hypothetical protein
MDNAAIDTGLKILISAAAVITGWYAALKPFFIAVHKRKQQKREAIERTLKEDKDYRKLVLEKLDMLDQHIIDSDTALALLQRDNIERAYCMFVVEHGYCPSGMKQSIYDMYEYYLKKGNNHIAKERVEEIMRLPEFPQEYEED